MRKKEENKKFNLEECCVLWKNTSKNGGEYLKGKDLVNDKKVVGFINVNTNEKLPKVKVYSIDSEGNTLNEIITLWETKSKQNNIYLSGYTDDKEDVLGFYCEELSENSPYIKIYFKETDK